MFITKTLSLPLITSLAFMLCSCDRYNDSHAVDAVKQQQQDQYKKIEQLEKQQLELANSAQLIARAVSNIDARQQALTYTEFNPNQTRYFILNNGSIGLAGRILSISPITDGSVIHISLVNLLSVPLSNIGFQMTWGNEKPQEMKDLAHWQQLLFSTHMNSNIELLPGKWQSIDITLKGVSPNNLKYLKMSIDMNNIIIGASPLPKPEDKKIKK